MFLLKINQALSYPHLLKNDSIIAQLIEEGIEGIEIYFADNGTNPQSKYTEIAKKHNLLISGGSDCHGLTKGKILLGKVKVPYQVIEAMREFIRKR